MPSRKHEDSKEIIHEHQWSIRTDDISCERCGCGAIKISQAEYNRRKDEWNNYFELVRTTSSYFDYQKQKQAYKSKDMQTIKEIAKHALERLKEGEYLPKPHFPDPATWNEYVINTI